MLVSESESEREREREREIQREKKIDRERGYNSVNFSPIFKICYHLNWEILNQTNGQSGPGCSIFLVSSKKIYILDIFTNNILAAKSL